MVSCAWPGLVTGKTYEWYVILTDELGNSSTSPAWRFVTSPNAAPFAANQLVTVVGDAPAEMTLPASDPNGDVLTFSLNTLPTRGLIFNFDTNNGTLTYVPARGYRGSDRLIYQASDGLLRSPAVSMNLNVVAPPDVNANGLPDAWEAAYGVTNSNADDDNDGQTNLQECLAGTNPTNAASVFRILAAPLETNGQWVLTWSSVGGSRYRVQFRNGSTNSGVKGAFTDIVRPLTNEMDLGPYGAPSTQAFTDDFALTGGPPAGGARYYRVKIAP